MASERALGICPDCGGLLAPADPIWIAAIELLDAAPREERQAGVWHCPLCGYRERQTDPTTRDVGPLITPHSRLA